MKTRTIISIGFVLAMLAGVALGVLADRTIPARRQPGAPGTRGGPDRDRGSWLADQLNLSPGQREQMDAIWSKLLKTHGRGAQPDPLRSLQKERDEAIVALFTPEQKQAYDRIVGEHQKRVEEMSSQRDKAFADAVEATNKILNPEQRAKYAELMKKRRGPGGPGGSGGPGGPPPRGMSEGPDGGHPQGSPRGPHTRPAGEGESK